MAHYALRRALQSIPLLILLTVISFTIIHLAPGGPISFMGNPRMTPADQQRLEEMLGLHESLPVQYVKWVGALARLDLGRSYHTREPVLTMIATRLPATLLLMGVSLVLGTVIGVPLGIYAALRRGSWIDNAIRVASVAGSAVPSYWMGLILIIVLAGELHLLPAGGMYDVRAAGFDLWDRLEHIVLPALVLSTGGWVVFTRFLRSEVLEVLGQDYVRTARSKGLWERVVLSRHVLRNALLPVVTIMGGTLAGLFSGAALVEIVFSWPGIGSMTLNAATGRDYPVVLGVLMISAVLVILGNVLADLAYGLVDPRVTYH